MRRVFVFLLSLTFTSQSFAFGLYETQKFSTPMYAFEQNLSNQVLTSYIDKTLQLNRFQNKIESYELANIITEVSNCFEIDPFIFSGMIFWESRYYVENTSPTDAVGLTQMTSIAIKEVHDQMGYFLGPHAKKRGFYNQREAREETNEQIDEILTGCVAELREDKKWQYIWEEEGFRNWKFYKISHYNKTSYGKSIPSYRWDNNWIVEQIKNRLKADPLMSVVYGAVLLKTIMAYSLKIHPKYTMIEHYKYSVRRYNASSEDERDKLETNTFKVAYALLKEEKDKILLGPQMMTSSLLNPSPFSQDISGSED